MSKPTQLLANAIFAMSFGAASANAGIVDWVDWTGGGIDEVYGTLGSGLIDVTYSGKYVFVDNGSHQISGGAIVRESLADNYWIEGNPAPYTNNGIVDNPPPGSDIIALVEPGPKTIYFSGPVVDPLFAFQSWQFNGANFGTPITILSFGEGFWGNAPVSLAFGGHGFTSSADSTGYEPHGVLQIHGTFTEINFEDSFWESWHGFTVGVLESNLPVPEPASLTLFGAGLAGLAWVRRRKKA